MSPQAETPAAIAWLVGLSRGRRKALGLGWPFLTIPPRRTAQGGATQTAFGAPHADDRRFAVFNVHPSRPQNTARSSPAIVGDRGPRGPAGPSGRDGEIRRGSTSHPATPPAIRQPGRPSPTHTLDEASGGTIAGVAVSTSLATRPSLAAETATPSVSSARSLAGLTPALVLAARARGPRIDSPLGLAEGATRGVRRGAVSALARSPAPLAHAPDGADRRAPPTRPGAQLASPDASPQPPFEPVWPSKETPSPMPSLSIFERRRGLVELESPLPVPRRFPGEALEEIRRDGSGEATLRTTTIVQAPSDRGSTGTTAPLPQRATETFLSAGLGVIAAAVQRLSVAVNQEAERPRKACSAAPATAHNLGPARVNARLDEAPTRGLLSRMRALMREERFRAGHIR